MKVVMTHEKLHAKLVSSKNIKAFSREACPRDSRSYELKLKMLTCPESQKI